MKKNRNSNELALFFLVAFVSQILMMTWASYALSMNGSKADSEISADEELSDELDADESDFSTLIEEELEKQYFCNESIQLSNSICARKCFRYVHSKSDYISLKNHVPPENFS
ncbi:MAG: hypothetical protein RLZZ531_411 [Bacteroidota bacterium]|jgi:hypothetical protein